jgi:ribosome maturation factor RimP
MLDPVYIGALRQPNLSKAMDSITPVIEAASLILLGLERAQEGRRTVLWVYLDHPEGVTLDQCAEVSPEISAILDVEDPIPEAYDLRVSSPGIERPLMSDQQFKAHLNHPAKIRLLSPLRGRRKFQGKIIDVLRGDDSQEADIHLKCDDGEHYIPVSLILRAHLHYSNDEIKTIFRERRAAERVAELEKSSAESK